MINVERICNEPLSWSGSLQTAFEGGVWVQAFGDERLPGVKEAGQGGGRSGAARWAQQGSIWHWPGGSAAGGSCVEDSQICSKS